MYLILCPIYSNYIVVNCVSSSNVEEKGYNVIYTFDPLVVKDYLKKDGVKVFRLDDLTPIQEIKIETTDIEGVG